MLFIFASFISCHSAITALYSFLALSEISNEIHSFKAISNKGKFSFLLVILAALSPILPSFGVIFFYTANKTIIKAYTI